MEKKLECMAFNDESGGILAEINCTNSARPDFGHHHHCTKNNRGDENRTSSQCSAGIAIA